MDLQEQITQANKQIEAINVDNVLNALMEKFVVPELRAGATSILRERFSLITVNGEKIPVVLDANRKPILNTNGYKTIEEEIYEWGNTQEGKAYFAAPKNSGGIDAGKPARPGAGIGFKRSKMTREEKADYVSKHGESAYWKLPK